MKALFYPVLVLILVSSSVFSATNAVVAQLPNADKIPADPSIADVLYDAADTFINQGDPDRAIPLLQTLIKHLTATPDSDGAGIAFVYMKLARLYSDKKDYGKARELLFAAETRLQAHTRQNPDAPPTYSILWHNDFGQLEHKQGNHDKAEIQFRTAILKMIEHGQHTSMLFATTLNNIALSLAIQGKTVEARSCLTRALEIVNNTPQATDAERQAIEENLEDLQKRILQDSAPSQAEAETTTE